MGLGAAVFAVRRYRLKRSLTQDLQNDMEDKIFKKGHEEDDATLGADSSAMSSNPMYGHASVNRKGGVAPLVTAAGVVLSSETPAVTDTSVAGKLLRSRFSFHGTENDEIDVAAGEAMTAIERNADWYLVKLEGANKVGLIPATYVVDT